MDQIVEVKFTGTTALVLHNERTANPLDPYTKKIKAITSKRNKTDEDHEAIMRLEWEAGFYGSLNGAPLIPSANIRACLIAGGKRVKLGSKIASALTALETFVPIAYDGPPVDRLTVETPGFSLTKTVRVGTSRTMRTRPCIPTPWSIRAEFLLLESMNGEDLLQAAELAGRYCGLGDARTLGMGRFAATLREVQ